MNQKILIIVALLSASITHAQETYRLDDGAEVIYPATVVDTYQYDRVKKFSFTPSVNLLSFPHQFDGSLEMVFAGDIGIKYSQSLKTSGVFEDNNIDLDNRMIALRAYPNRGSWFVGMGYGHHEVKVDRTDVVNGFDTTTYARIDSDYITPTTGFKWVYDNGISLGVEIGWIFGINSTTDIYSDQDANPLVSGNSDYYQHRQDAEDSISKYVSDGTISVGLLELGFTF